MEKVVVSDNSSSQLEVDFFLQDGVACVFVIPRRVSPTCGGRW